MLVTIIEANVSSAKWADLELAYRAKVKKMPQQLRETFLLHDKDRPRVWRIVSVWHSPEDFEEAQNAGQAETCVQIFRSIGIEPTRRIFDVVTRHTHV